MKHTNYRKTLILIILLVNIFSITNVFASEKINNSNKINSNELTIITNIKPFILESNLIYNKVNFDKSGCGIISEDLRTWLNNLLNVIRIGGLVLTLIFGMLDFTKATLSNDKDAIKKAQGNFSKRLIAVVLLFIIPAVISFILNVSGITIFSTNPFCGIE